MATPTLEELQARLVALKKARDTGVFQLRKGDDQVQYRSLEEINEIIADLEGDIAALTETTRVRRVRFHDRTGW